MSMTDNTIHNEKGLFYNVRVNLHKNFSKIGLSVIGVLVLVFSVYNLTNNEKFLEMSVFQSITLGMAIFYTALRAEYLDHKKRKQVVINNLLHEAYELTKIMHEFMDYRDNWVLKKKELSNYISVLEDYYKEKHLFFNEQLKKTERIRSVLSTWDEIVGKEHDKKEEGQLNKKELNNLRINISKSEATIRNELRKIMMM